MLATETPNLSWIPRALTVKGENQLPKVALGPPHVCCGKHRNKLMQYLRIHMGELERLSVNKTVAVPGDSLSSEVQEPNEHL